MSPALENASLPKEQPKSVNLSLLLAGFGILLVAFGHSDPTPTAKVAAQALAHPGYAVFGNVIQWIYTFHMPLFFFLAGLNYLRYTASRESSFLRFYLGKAQRLLVPYLIFSSIAFPIKALLSHFAVRHEPLRFSAYLDGLIDPWHNPIIFFWFLPTLFLVFGAADLLRKAVRSGRLIASLTFVIVAVLYLGFPEKGTSWLRCLNLSGALHSVVFFYLGMLFHQFQWERAISPFWIIAGVFSCLVTFFVPVFPPLQGLLASFLGIAFLIGFTCLWFKFPAMPAFFGRHSFQIYLFSWFPQVAARILFGQMLGLNFWLVITAMFLGGLFVPICAHLLLNSVIPRRWQLIYGQ